MDKKGVSELKSLLEGITSKIGDFTGAINNSSKKLDSFSKTIDTKILNLNENIKQLTNVISDEDKKLSSNLESLIKEVTDEIRKFKEEVQISDIKEILVSLQKIITIPEKTLFDKTVQKLMKEIFDIAKDLKGIQ